MTILRKAPPEVSFLNGGRIPKHIQEYRDSHSDSHSHSENNIGVLFLAICLIVGVYKFISYIVRLIISHK